jgi:DNA polymerase V
LLGWNPAEWDDDEHLQPGVASRRSVTCTRSFGRPQHEPAVLAEAVASFAARAAEKLRRHGLAAHLLTVILGTDKYAPIAGPKTHTTVLNLAHATHHSGELTRAALRGLHQLRRPGVAYHRAGVVLSGLEPMGQAQLDLFGAAAADQQRGQRLMTTLERLERSFRPPAGAARRGRRRQNPPLASPREPAWAGRAAHRSPRYTTGWDELWELC